ncbi:hypothetical protein ACQKOF_13555 [Lysinibacillus sp. NPDC093190]|uniref:hypothetical protein n=1 Tax=Lysinibacillus sp. NPDC093190 TaxID=3390575 RepID=UPI003CFD53DD
MKWIHVLGIIVLTASLSIGGTYLMMKKNYENEKSKSTESELDSGQSISKDNKKKEFVSTVDTTIGWKNQHIPK